MGGVRDAFFERFADVLGREGGVSEVDGGEAREVWVWGERKLEKFWKWMERRRKKADCREFCWQTMFAVMKGYC